ncbi:hypothetical protein DUI87_04286 [Hirundo rustica rustica]|uniref:Uncharacterized protein n=1 Tax=Hirundo rustica rustica TaxID=333673 RepID=A0A3M0L5X9_HIRRU|nr:hypothetical protein DUI87_04286 [Hirundo rustica rustica]
MQLAEKQKTLKHFTKNTCVVSLVRGFQGNVCPGRQVLVLQSSWKAAEDTRCGLQGASQPGRLEMLHQAHSRDQQRARREAEFLYTKVSFKAGRKRFELEMTAQREGPKQCKQVQECTDNSLVCLIEELISKGALLDLRIKEELLGNVKVDQHSVQCL